MFHVLGMTCLRVLDDEGQLRVSPRDLRESSLSPQDRMPFLGLPLKRRIGVSYRSGGACEVTAGFLKQFEIPTNLPDNDCRGQTRS